MSTDDEERTRLQQELENDILLPAGARGLGGLPMLGEWLFRAHGLIFLPDGGGALTVWGYSVVKLALCTMLQAAQDSPDTFPNDLVQWLRTYVLRPSAAEDEVARMALEVVQRVSAGLRPAC